MSEDIINIVGTGCDDCNHDGKRLHKKLQAVDTVKELIKYINPDLTIKDYDAILVRLLYGVELPAQRHVWCDCLYGQWCALMDQNGWIMTAGGWIHKSWPPKSTAMPYEQANKYYSLAVMNVVVDRLPLSVVDHTPPTF